MEQPGLISGIILFIGFAFIGYILISCTCQNANEEKQQLTLFFVAFVTRFLFSLLLYQFGFIDVIKDEDGSGWVIGRAVQQDWVQQGYSIIDTPWLWMQTYSARNRGYWYILALFFFITDQSSRLAAAVLNCFFGSWTVILVYRIGTVLFSKGVGNWAGWLTCLFPSMIVWSSQTIKEPVVIFLETVVLYGCVQMRRNGFSLRYLLITIISCIVIFPLRFYATYIAALSIIITTLTPKFSSKHTTAIVLWVLSIPFVLGTVYVVQQEIRIDQFNLEKIESMKEYGAKTEGSGVDFDYDLQSPSGFAFAVGIGAAYLLFSPFPWEMSGGSMRMLLVGPEVLIWWVIFAYAVVPGFLYCVKKRFLDILPVVLFLAGLGLLYSVTFNNVGLAFRQRAQLLPYFFLFAGVGFEYRKIMAQRKKQSAHTRIMRPVPSIPVTPVEKLNEQ